MKRNGILFALALYGAACFANPDLSLYAKPDFETYLPILERMPFGAPPDPNAATAPPTRTELDALRAQQTLAKQVNMSGMVTIDGKLMIGFTDLSAKPPVNIFLAVGESSDGWKVIEADDDEQTATVSKEVAGQGAVEISLQFGKGVVEPAAPPLGPGGRPNPAFAAASQGVAAAAQINALPVVRPPTPLPTSSANVPGLVRAPTGVTGVTVAPVGARLSGRTGAAATPAASGSYRDRLNSREEAKQIAQKMEQEEADRQQRETLKNIAAAAAQEAIRKQQRDASEDQEGDPFFEEEE
ncbi:MAG: hypothetical protein FWG50_14275 [Kiritimatiellaeota bacterium]|nr:hypothetical protein [Kiritimatiellota bacterium]